MIRGYRAKTILLIETRVESLLFQVRNESESRRYSPHEEIKTHCSATSTKTLGHEQHALPSDRFTLTFKMTYTTLDRSGEANILF